MKVWDYYLNLTEGTDIDAFNEEIQENFAGSTNTVINIETTVKGAGSVYVSLMTVIVIAVLVLSAIIIVFVLYLLVRTLMNNKKHDYGILKSLGYTTGQLVFQTAFSFMPTVVLSTIAGLMISAFIINPLLSLFLSTVGIVKCTFAVPVGFIVIVGVGLVFFAFGMACLLSLKIKRITPKVLLAGE